jgi:V-type H+-transporting ATPase subunit a
LASIEKNLQYFCWTNNAYGDKGSIKYSLYRLFFEQEKMIYTTLNKCIIRDTFVDGHVWIPKNEVGKVTSILKNLFGADQENKTSAYLEDLFYNQDIKPPTYISTNEFTAAFQEVVDTYGIPRYREINPGYFTIVTFPFLFGVMFGDIGHGLMLLIFSVYLCLFNNKLSQSKSLLENALFARYFLLLMGFFAVYCGLLYNDFLSVPIYYKTCYEVDSKKEKDQELSKDYNCSYGFGLDPAWYLATNELTFMNSLKMKLSVILGVFQMVIGIILKGLNSLFEGDMVEFVFIFIPQIVLMLALFGYMDFLIFVKWATEYNIEQIDEKKINSNIMAPDIKSYLMSIFLNFGELPSPPKIGDYQLEWRLLTDGKKMKCIHLGILFCSLFCMILMFFPKIFINYSKSKKKYNNQNNLNRISNNLQEQLIPQKELEEPAFSNFFVECAIETIEFVLGTVSNTASYLRLWALSLAHSQLAVVFFSKTVALFGNSSDKWYINGVLLLLIFPIFAGATAIVLLFMDVMECFLHTLRLHWVEFQNKFYKADGYQFKPFYFPNNISLIDEEYIGKGE